MVIAGAFNLLGRRKNAENLLIIQDALAAKYLENVGGHNGLPGKADKRTQQAVIMSLFISGEAATKGSGPDRIH